jgi:hypothetical protein
MMRCPGSIVLPLILACCSMVRGVPAIADSAAYQGLRQRCVADSATRSALETADALAAEDLYVEAMEILSAFVAPPDASPSRDSISSEKPGHWRASTGLDYYHLEDLDTAAMTREEAEKYRRLTETPLSVWGRAGYEHGFKRGRIAPECYISGYRSRLEVPVRIDIVKDRLTLEAAGRAEKWFQADATGDSAFNPSKGYPSDMGGASLRLTPESALGNDGVWAWSAPCMAKWEHYGEDRSGYASFFEHGIAPAVEYRREGTVQFSSRLSGEMRIRNYYREASDSLDVVSESARFESSLRTALVFLHAGVEWFEDRHVNAHAPAQVDRWQGSVRAGSDAWKPLSPRLTVRAIHARELNEPAIDSGTYALPGSELTVRSSIRWTFTDRISLEPELTWERRWAEIIADNYLWQARSAVEPMVRGELSLKNLSFAVFGGYRWEDVDAGFERFVNDNKGFRAGLDVQVRLMRRFLVSALVDYQFRRYDAASRQSENLTASCSVVADW